MSYELSLTGRPLGSVSLWLIRLLALAAAGLAGYLSWKSFSHGPIVGCSGAELVDCESVLATNWSQMLGVPVAILGTLCYLAIFVVSWLAGSRNIGTVRAGIFVLTLLTATAVAAALWFSGLQVLVLKEYCVFCLAVHACGMAIAIILAVGLTPACREAQRLPKPVGALQSALAVRPTTRQLSRTATAVTGLGQFLMPVLLGLLATGGLIASQWLLPARSYQVAEAEDIAGSFDMDSKSPAMGDLANSEEPHIVHRIASRNESEEDELAGTGNELVYSTAAVESNDPQLTDDPATDRQTSAAYNGDEDESKKVIDRSFVNEKKSRTVKLLDGKISFDIYEQAYIGSPESPYVILELFDYTCKHCRKVHEMLVNARYRYGGQLTIVAMPVPLEIKCNPLMRRAGISHLGACKLATLALTVAKVNPRAFGGFHDWLMADKERGRDYDVSLVRAYEILGRDRVRNVMNSQEFSDRIRRHVNLYGNLSRQWKSEKGFGLPVLIVGDKIFSGTIEYEMDLHELLESGLDIKPVR